MKDIKVKMMGLVPNSQTISAAGALGCFEEKSSIKIYEELRLLSKSTRLKKEKAIIKNSFGRGHGSVGDQNHFVFSIEGLPRLATLQLCLPEYLAHLQQSLRRAKASKGFYLSAQIRKSTKFDVTKNILSKSFELYEEMIKANIPGEDARFLLPLATRTNIQTAGNARELTHLWLMSQDVKTPQIVKAVVNKMLTVAKSHAPELFSDFDFNYERLAWYPSAQLYSSGNYIVSELVKFFGKKNASLVNMSNNIYDLMDNKMMERAIKERNETELANLKHIHFEFLVGMSIACLHQAIRQRTWNHSLESIYDAVKKDLRYKNRMIIPPSIKNSSFCLKYVNQHRAMMNQYKLLIEIGILESEAIGVVPHSLKIYTLIHVNGWNAIHSIGKRTCLTAQWEIRKIAKKMAKTINDQFPIIGKWAKPQCVTYSQCPESENCGYYKKQKK